MRLKGLENSLLAEGLSDKGKVFLDVMKWILSMGPQELLSLYTTISDGVFQMPFSIISESTGKPKITGPKGDFAEIARGSDHRAVSMRFITPDGSDKVFYFVIPLLSFDGTELTDNEAKSGIENRFKEIITGLSDGQDMNNVLRDIFTDPESAKETLRRIDRFVTDGSPAEREQMAQQAPDPLRDGAVQAVKQFLPSETKHLETLLKMHPGQLAQLFGSNWGLDQDAQSEFVSQAASLADGGLEDPRAVKLIAGLALAHQTCSVLERTRQ